MEVTLLTNSKQKGEYTMNIEIVKAAGIRAVKTMIQTFLASVAVGQGLQDIEWLAIGSIVIVAGMLSFLNNIIALPPEITKE